MRGERRTICSRRRRNRRKRERFRRRKKDDKGDEKKKKKTSTTLNLHITTRQAIQHVLPVSASSEFVLNLLVVVVVWTL